MAIVSMLAGGMLGLFSAVFSLLALDASWLMALGLWSGVGAVAAFALLGFAMLPHRKLAAQHRTEHA